jgi:pre-rRNA-processing protein TSR4
MESSAKKLSSLRITSLDGDDDETEDPHQPPPAGPSAAAADSDDDDEEEEAEVTLGVLSKPKHPGLLLRHLFPSKAGGIPVRAPTRDKFQQFIFFCTVAVLMPGLCWLVQAWLDPVNLPSGKSSCCGFCGEPLQFVLQVISLCSMKL